MRQRGFAVAGALVLAAGLASPALAEKAPPVTPSKWLNSKIPVSWDQLKGRVILVEKWATT